MEVAPALEDYQQAYRIFAEGNLPREQARSLVSIAMLYNEAADHPTALKYYNQAINTFDADPLLLVSVLNNRGIVLTELKRFSEAVPDLQQALALARRVGNRTSMAHVMGSLARAQRDAGQIRAATRTVQQGLVLVDSNDRSGVRMALLSVAARLALDRGRTKEARLLVNSVFAEVDIETTTLSLRDIHSTAYNAFKANGDFAGALVHLEALKRLDEKAARLATSSMTALMTARFDFQNQELRIARLKADDLRRSIGFQQAQARLERIVFVSAGIGVALLIGLLTFGLFTLRRSRNQVREANARLMVNNTALNKALAAKTEFLATTSHEIRTPLNGILGMTQVMLADRALQPDLRERIDVVHGAGMAMRVLVDDILDVAKMESGKLSIESLTFDMQALLREVASLWGEQARGRGIGFRFEDEGVPRWLEGDPTRIRQVLFNLLSNALKFTREGEIAVLAAASGDRLQIRVRDSGIGIASDRLERVFDSFQQADAGTTRHYGGTGLGLTICRNLARAMGGDILPESTVGEGSTFTLDLPLREAEAGAALAECDDPAGCAMLVIETNPIRRSMLRTLLEPHAAPLVFVDDAAEAAIRIRRGGVAHVLLDEQAVGGDPDTAAAALARIATLLADGDSRLAVLWQRPDDALRHRLHAAGAQLVLAKPISGAALVEAIFPPPAATDTETLAAHAA